MIVEIYKLLPSIIMITERWTQVQLCFIGIIFSSPGIKGKRVTHA